MKKLNSKLSPKEIEKLLKTLKTRFEKNMSRHKGLEWAKVQAKLESNKEKLWSLNAMEGTGGEPDVVGYDNKTGEYIFYDCAVESPKGRRSVCYDHEALESRKEHKPEDSAAEMATGAIFEPEAMGGMVSKRAAALGVPRKSLYRILYRFWMNGQVRDALLPNYEQSGAPGKVSS